MKNDICVAENRLLDLLPIMQKDLHKKLDKSESHLRDLIFSMLDKGLIIRYVSGRGYLIVKNPDFVRGNVISNEKNYEISPKYRARENIVHGYSNEANLKRIEEEGEWRKEKDLFAKNARLIYRDKIKEILPSMKTELEIFGKCFISMRNMRKFLGKEFDVYKDITIYLNMKYEMEGDDVRVGIKRHERGSNIVDYLTFRYKREGEKFSWEKQGFSSRKEYEEYLDDNRKCKRNCEIIRKIAKDCKEKDPESIFNNKELIKKMFSACPIDDDEKENLE